MIRSTPCNFHLHIGRARQYLSDAACQTAIQSLVLSRMDYCCSLLGNIPQAQVHKLQLVQKRAARLITRASPRDHIKLILARLHWLPVHMRIQFRILVHTYKCLHASSPPYISDMISRYAPTRQLRSSNDITLLNTRRTAKSVGRGDFRFMAPFLWNELPRHIRERPSVVTFKRHLKAFYYSQYFN